ncbi:MAG: 6-phosphogluconolactonase, partial [Cyclobacteriaceae bacterium]
VRHEQELKDVLPANEAGLPVFDMIMLGMGGDGHTASIFPHQMELLASNKICEVAEHPESGQKRVSITGPVINAAKEVVFLVTGAGKAEKIDEIFYQKGRAESYPAAHVKPTSGRLSWYLDSAAAANL